MISRELIDVLNQLNRADKLAVIQLLASDLAAQEQPYFNAGAVYEVWSPYDAPQAAQALLDLLDQDRAKHE